MNIILSNIENNLRNIPINDLYKISNNIQTSSQQLLYYYPNNPNIINLNFLTSLSNSNKELLLDYIMTNKEIYWVIREIIQNAINKGSLNLNELSETNINTIVESTPFIESVVEALSNKKILIINKPNGNNKIQAKINGNMKNELKTIKMKPHTLLPIVQNILDVNLPQNGETLVYESLLHDLGIVLNYNRNIFTSKTNIIGQILKKFGDLLNQINTRIQKLIQTKSQSGGNQIIHRLATMSSSKLKTIESQIGSAKMHRLINRCGCEKDSKTITNKLNRSSK
jgi:hypothetical protein